MPWRPRERLRTLLPMAPPLPLDVIRAALDEGRLVRLRARGRSMAPALRDGEPVELWPLAGAPRPGQVVACAAGGALVLHRVVACDASMLVLRGDARARPDPPRAPAAVLGEVRLAGGRAVPPARRGALARRIAAALARLGREGAR